MGLALYRKYRPKKLSEVVGQDHIIRTLKNALDSGKLSHAYLFTGPRGVGKTSVARILAHEINGLPYTDDSMHLDIIEIDAASNRRIDEIRDLRDKVHIAPTSAKYKVYIIDEVHMLTREAFNALLKTLEEPPGHVVFILATTESHKVPDTIASRTQRFTFKPITLDDTVGHLKELAKSEKIKIKDDALAALADHAGGSFRDSINLLDQMVGDDGTIEKSDVESMLGIPDSTVIDRLYASAEAGDIQAIAAALADARISGTDAATLARRLGSTVRQKLLNNGTQPDQKTVTYLRNIVLATAHPDPFSALELALFEYASVPNSPQVKPASVHAPIKEKSISIEAAPEPPLAKVTASNETYWLTLLDTIKNAHNTLYSMLRMAEPTLEDNKLTLAFAFPFHQKQISTATNQKRISDAASELLGRPIVVTSIHKKDAVTSHSPKVAAKPPLTNVFSIFDGAELIE